MLEKFKEFIADKEARDMYITGRAGTGKTTDVAELVAYCIAADIDATIAAYTHKAVGVLETKMPPGTVLSTLHSFLGKRPTINDTATKIDHVEQSRKCSDTKEASILFIDEYSMIGEKDYLDIVDAQDERNLKVVWIGDPYQLPPVKDQPAVNPSGDYCVTLTEIKRQAKDNPLGEALEQLVSFIEGAPAEPLLESSKFIRGQNIVQEYITDKEEDKVLLAYTNKRVQEMNAAIQGYQDPKEGDILWSPTTQQVYEFMGIVDRPTVIWPHFGEPLELGSKFKTLEHLIYRGTKFCALNDEDGNDIVVAYEFGHNTFKEFITSLKAEAAESNNAIRRQMQVDNAAQWAKQNYDSALARKRSAAWRDFLSFNSTALCLDFAHAMTVHKSQGSTFNTVYVDTNDIHSAASFSFEQYLKLMYVALSRASNKVITN